MKYQEITFTDADIVNPADYIPTGEYNPNDIFPYLLHDHGFVLAVVFAEGLSDALDIAFDAGKLNGFIIAEEDMKEYDAGNEPTYLGNAGEPCDVEGIGFTRLPNPPFSFTALLQAALDNHTIPTPSPACQDRS